MYNLRPELLAINFNFQYSPTELYGNAAIGRDDSKH